MTNKNDFMVFKRYKEELELILRQNPYMQTRCRKQDGTWRRI